MKIFSLVLILLSWSPGPLVPGPDITATIQTREGFYIFVFSKPVSKYVTLGVFKVPQKFTGEPKEQIRTATQKANKDYQGANGIIFTDDNLQFCEVIKLEL